MKIGDSYSFAPNFNFSSIVLVSSYFVEPPGIVVVENCGTSSGS